MHWGVFEYDFRIMKVPLSFFTALVFKVMQTDNFFLKLNALIYSNVRSRRESAKFYLNIVPMWLILAFHVTNVEILPFSIRAVLILLKAEMLENNLALFRMS